MIQLQALTANKQALSQRALEAIDQTTTFLTSKPRKGFAR